MNPIAQKYGAGPLAGVNLIPLEIAERKKMRGVISVAIFAVLIAVAVVAVGFALTLVGRLAVEADRDQAAQDELAAVASRDSKSGVYDEVRAREQEEYTLAQIGFGEINYAQLTASIQSTAVEGTSFDLIHVAGPNAEGLPVEDFDGTAYGAGVGQLEFTARAESVEAAHALMARLEALPGIANVRGVTEKVGSDGADVYWQVEGVASLTDLLLTSRLVPTDGIAGISEVLAPIVEPDIDPSASPSPEPSPSEGG